MSNNKEKHELSEEVLVESISLIADCFDKDLYEKTKDDLERYWHWKYDSDCSKESNLYEFYDCLTMYAYFCEKWETHHNTTINIVSRMRDQYIMPKIRLFWKEFKRWEERNLTTN